MVMGYTRCHLMLLLSCYLAVFCRSDGKKGTRSPTTHVHTSDTWPPCKVGQNTSSNNAACDVMTSTSSVVVTPTVQPFGSISSTTSYGVSSGGQSFSFISTSNDVTATCTSYDVTSGVQYSCTTLYDFTPGGFTSEAQPVFSSSSYDASSNIGTTTISMTASSVPDYDQYAATISSNVGAIATGTIVPIIAIAVIVAIVIILVLRKSKQHSKWRPLETEVNGLDNVVYNDSSTTIGMNTLAPYVIYEPLKDAEMANYDYIDEDCNPYIIPASHEEELYVQLENQRIKKIPRNKIEATTMLGSGQFGGVQIGIWNGSKGKCEVAIKTLNPTITQPDAKVKFLQEAAIMAQFRHPNVIQLYGIVTDGEPIMLVLELANKKDLRTYLSTLKPDPGQMVHSDIPISLLTYSKQIAAGMKYLSNKSFVHRDLAARNILVTQDCICKIADFGMSRDLADDTYYVSHGGMVPIKWTAPEAIHFKKYSTASDVWSYGCLLYEIWSMGMKPFEGKGNAEVIQKVDSGYRLPPPPGCPLLVYQLMIQCWNPETHSRPKFGEIVQSLRQPKEIVLVIPDEAHLTHPQAGVLGAHLEAGESMYIELQKMYMVYV